MAAEPGRLWAPGDPPAGLYIHIPFCRFLCTYCAFSKEIYVRDRAERWLAGLERELWVRSRESFAGRLRVDTVFLGGGTPSALTAGQIERLGELLARHLEFDASLEFTTEANPESFTAGIAAAFRAIGVNRVSLGAQSFDRRELELLGRPHGIDAPARAVSVARDSGFDNVSVDVMYGLPAQDLATFARSVDAVLDLETEHVSAYCLGLEPGTPLAVSVAEGALPAPDDDAARDQYDHLVAAVEARGYEVYEISNFARKGREAAHNLKYWRREDCFALGPSSHALVRNHRWANPAGLDRWVAAYAETGRPPRPRPVPEDLARFEYVFLHLRLSEGLDPGGYRERWGRRFEDDYADPLERMVDRGLLVRAGGRIRLAPRARFVSDAVFAEFAPAES